jgi:hypothetical protein
VKEVSSRSQLQGVSKTLIDKGLAQGRRQFAQHNGTKEGVAILREEGIHLCIELRGTTVTEVRDVEEEEGTVEWRRQVGADEKIFELCVRIGGGRCHGSSEGGHTS